MTTKVTIKFETPNHQDILVEQFNPVTGSLCGVARRFSETEQVDFWVHTGASLRITEIPKVAKVTGD